jgi:putative Mg2+ transporter-C (MgtC) family protein
MGPAMIGTGDVVLRLSVAAIFGMLVGIERERRLRAAGMRTLALVGLGSALFTLVSAYAFNDLTFAHHLSFDPTRVMAQIVSGIGFLGAGTIFLRRDVVRGLTTAAALWVVAAIGMAVGAGLWAPAITGIVAVLVVLAVLWPIERVFFPQNSPHTVRVRIASMVEASALIGRVHDEMSRAGVLVEAVSVRAGTRKGEIIQVNCRFADVQQLAQAVQRLRQLPGVQAVRADVPGLRPGRSA